jgi:hypothetical protein
MPKRSRSGTRTSVSASKRRRNTPRTASKSAATPAQIRSLVTTVVREESRKRAARSRSASRSRIGSAVERQYAREMRGSSPHGKRRRIGSAVERQYAREMRRSSPYGTRSIVAAIEQPTLEGLINSAVQTGQDKTLADFISKLSTK